MKVIIQRVQTAKVEVESKTVGEIGPGLLVLLGIHHEDSENLIDPLLEKMINLRIFRDDQDKMNLSLLDTKGSLLIVSQFTLYANCKSGRRPSSTESAPPEKANELYEAFVAKAKTKVETVERGIFGAYMQVHIVNDGPVTMTLES